MIPQQIVITERSRKITKFETMKDPLAKKIRHFFFFSCLVCLRGDLFSLLFRATCVGLLMFNTLELFRNPMSFSKTQGVLEKLKTVQKNEGIRAIKKSEKVKNESITAKPHCKLHNKFVAEK